MSDKRARAAGSKLYVVFMTCLKEGKADATKHSKQVPDKELKYCTQGGCSLHQQQDVPSIASYTAHCFAYRTSTCEQSKSCNPWTANAADGAPAVLIRRVVATLQRDIICLPADPRQRLSAWLELKVCP